MESADQKPAPRPLRCGRWLESQAWRNGCRRIAGVDEVGRGSLFGPVVAAAVILNPQVRIRGLNDSKQLEPEERERLAGIIRKSALGIAVAAVDAARIDLVNIREASRIAMRKAVLAIHPPPDFLLVDALEIDVRIAQRLVIHGDCRSASIAAASIVAKVERDAWMRQWDRALPGWGLAEHKGYYTPEHMEALAGRGPSPLHRRSFAPVAAVSLFPDDETPENLELFHGHAE